MGVATSLKNCGGGQGILPLSTAEIWPSRSLEEALYVHFPPPFVLPSMGVKADVFLQCLTLDHPSNGWEQPKQAGWEFRVKGFGLRV